MSEEKRDRGRRSNGDQPPGDPPPAGTSGSGSPAKGGDRSGESSRDRGPTGASGNRRKAGASGRSGLTERQRRQARELRKKRGRSRSGTGEKAGRPDRLQVGNAISRGLRATADETGRAIRFLAGRVTALTGRIGTGLLVVAEIVLAVGAALLTGLGRVVAAVASAAARVARRLDRVLTPFRAVLAVSILAGVMLAISQFLDYRAVEIGSAGYDQILDLTRAPRTDVQTPIDAHSIVLLVASLIALAASVGMGLTGRRAFGLPVLAVGVIALVTGLAVDLPRALDSAAASAAYADAEPILLGGFWLEIASGAVLTAGGLIMALGLTGERSTSRDRRLNAANRSEERRRERARAAAGGTA